MNKIQQDIVNICLSKGVKDEQRIASIIKDVYCSYIDFSECTNEEFTVQVEASISTTL